MTDQPIRAIFDTNVWISYLIGRQLKNITKLIVDKKIELILSDQLILEVKEVTSRPKFRKYFKSEKVEELLVFMGIMGTNYPIRKIPQICRDPKDNFLLGLISESDADYLVTGDKDLLSLNPFKNTKILEPVEFEQAVK